MILVDEVKMIPKALFLLLLLLIAVSSCFARQVVKIREVNNAVLVPVRVNGRDLSFLLDTGSEHSAIDASVASSLNLGQVANVEVLKNYRTQPATADQTTKIGIGGLAFDGKILTVLNLRSVARALGNAVDGVVGNDILQDFAFTLNYSREELVTGRLAELGDTGVPLKLRRSGDEFFVPIRLMSSSEELLLDTGTNSTNLSWGTWQQLSRVWTPDETIDGIVRAGFPTPPAFLVCVPDLRLGEIGVRDQAVRVQRAVNTGAFSSAGFGGTMGSEFLRQFEVTFDLKHDEIFLKKDPRSKPDPYRYVTVGIQFAQNDQGTYTVMSVWKNSPADQAGIRFGDRIGAINGASTASMTVEQVSAQLHGEEGTAVKPDPGTWRRRFGRHTAYPADALWTQ
jgi:peptidoglycan hydrolase-like protein with peptidoglycan-binding domain